MFFSTGQAAVSSVFNDCLRWFCDSKVRGQVWSTRSTSGKIDKGERLSVKNIPRMYSLILYDSHLKSREMEKDLANEVKLSDL